MRGPDFERIMRSAFQPFLDPIGFKMQPVHLSGRSYRASFDGEQHTLYVAFEPGDGYTAVMLQRKGCEYLSSLDDPETTLRLSDLNERYIGSVAEGERAENEAFFGHIESHDAVERKLIRCAKDLRLTLPRYLALPDDPLPGSRLCRE